MASAGGGNGIGNGGIGSKGGGGGGGDGDGFSGRGDDADYEASLRASGKSLDSLPAGAYSTTLGGLPPSIVALQGVHHEYL